MIVSSSMFLVSTNFLYSTCKNHCIQVMFILLYFNESIDMYKLDLLLSKFFDRFTFLGPLVLRLLLGLSFILYGSQKFPLPAEGLTAMGFASSSATIIPLIEVGAGLGMLVSGFSKGIFGRILTRISSLVIFIFMIAALFIAHQDWLINEKLFKSVQIFLLGVSFYFIVSPVTITNSVDSKERGDSS